MQQKSVDEIVAEVEESVHNALMPFIGEANNEQNRAAMAQRIGQIVSEFNSRTGIFHDFFGVRVEADPSDPGRLTLILDPPPDHIAIEAEVSGPHRIRETVESFDETDGEWK